MTTYRLFPATNGPATTANPTYNGNFISGVAFGVRGGGCWFTGYFWWVCSGGNQSTAPVKCALWSATSSGTGVVVPGSVVTSGTLTAGQWNFIPLASPILLAPSIDPGSSAHGSAYLAAVGCNGPFPDTNSFWSAAITNGPLTAYSGSAGATPAPYSLPQGCFTAGGSDPSTSMPNGASGTDNFWVDVQVSTVAPAAYNGSYRLWPSKADGNPVTSLDAPVAYTVATEVRLAQACTLNAVHYYSPSGAASLATRADVWSVSSGLSVASITAPSWLTEAGSAASAGAGWVKAAFAGGVTLGAGTYRVSVYNSAPGSGNGWSAKDASSSYWAAGAGSGTAGITQGPVYAPQLSSASQCWEYNGSAPGATPPYSSGVQEAGQSPFGQTPGGVVTFPQLYADGLAQVYWVDLEATPLASSGLLIASGII